MISNALENKPFRNQYFVFSGNFISQVALALNSHNVFPSYTVDEQHRSIVESC